MCGLSNYGGEYKAYHVYYFAGDSTQIPIGWKCQCGLTKLGDGTK